MISILFVAQIVLAILLTILVLLQKSSSIGLGAYSGSNESVFGAKGPAGFLVKATFTVGLIFIFNTVALGYLYNKEYNRSVVDNAKTVTPDKAPVPPKLPETPAAPKAPATPNPAAK
jgi:preprotein translocase subunit SecG